MKKSWIHAHDVVGRDRVNNIEPSSDSKSTKEDTLGRNLEHALVTTVRHINMRGFDKADPTIHHLFEKAFKDAGWTPPQTLMSKSTEAQTIDNILRDLCHDFENPKVDSFQAQIDAKVRLEKMQAKCVEEAVHSTLRESEITYAIDVLTCQDRKTAWEDEYQDLVNILLKNEASIVERLATLNNQTKENKS